MKTNLLTLSTPSTILLLSSCKKDDTTSPPPATVYTQPLSLAVRRDMLMATAYPPSSMFLPGLQKMPAVIFCSRQGQSSSQENFYPIKFFK